MSTSPEQAATSPWFSFFLEIRRLAALVREREEAASVAREPEP